MVDYTKLKLEDRPRRGSMGAIFDDMILCDKPQGIVESILDETPCGIKCSTKNDIYCPINTHRVCRG